MTAGTLAVLSLLLLVWAAFSGLLAARNVGGPIVFLAAGFLLGAGTWGPVEVDPRTGSVHLLAEVTLALLLFADASRVDVRALRRDLGPPVRMLGIGLPLSVVLGSALAGLLLGDLTWAWAAFVGAALAPTDAALSAQVIDDERVPARVRRLLNVESGLNDGIITPVVTFVLAVAAGPVLASGEGRSGGPGALLGLAIGAGVGVAVGTAGAWLVARAGARRWSGPGGRRIATLGAALSSFAAASSLGGNAFIAAFVAGLAFGAIVEGRDDGVVSRSEVEELPQLLGEVLALATWFVFGAALVPVALDSWEPGVVVYALLSLTIVRMLPVALAAIGSGLAPRTVLLVGWFGPRGLASVVFALLALERVGEAPVMEAAVSAVTLTVVLSVVLHGVTAGPLAGRYARTRRPPE